MSINMNPFVHTIVTLFLIRFFKLTGREKIFALLFGVLIDLDHLIKIPLYFKKYGFKVVRHFRWRTPLQEPISLLWIIPLAIYLDSWVPPLFFLSHIVLDYTMGYPKKPFFPFNNFEARKIQLKLSDAAKQLITFLFFLCLNLLLP